MCPNTKIKLIIVSENGQDKNGYPIKLENFRTVWAEDKGPVRSEFYPAYAAGTKVSTVFCVARVSYKNEEIVEHNGARYWVIRAFPKNQTEIELTCANEKVDHGGI